jgi:Spy/CpxP family protein refolding chaperone
MKSILITLLTVTTLSGAALAQEKEGTKGRHHHKHQHGMMAKQLNFSEDQKKQAKAFNEDFRKKMQELNKNENITVKEMRDRKAALHKEQKAKMDGLLTPGQKNKLVLLKAQQKVKADERYAKHLDKMKTTLALTDAQVSQLKTQREGTRSKMKALRGNESLSREQKQEKMMALKTEAKEQRKKLFTPDQLKKMEEMKKKHMDKNSAR